MLSVIDLSRVVQTKPLISDRLVHEMYSIFQRKGRVYLYLNQKGASHCIVCDTCQHIPRCASCDHILRYHEQPSSHLRCHVCNFTSPMMMRCPQRGCSGNMSDFGPRIQGVEKSLKDLFPDKKIVRIESPKSPKDILSIDEADIILGTQVSLYLDLKNIALVGVLFLESELSIPQYDIEEKIYHSVRMMSRMSPQIFLQTYSPDVPIVEDLVSGNFKTFFRRTLQERKQFGYPPFGEMVEIYIEKKTKKQLTTFCEPFLLKLDYLVSQSDGLHYDTSVDAKIGVVYRKKIILRGTGLVKILEQLSVDIMKNPGVWVQYC